MAPKYQDWLAAQIINEGNIISYRSLSRALKVHSNAAKEMLYDFHRTQNARKPGSVHATYILAGTRKPEAPTTSNGKPSSSKSDGDAIMSDMSFPSSMPDHDDAETDVEVIPVTTVTLVKEEDLEATKDSFEVLESIHIYSLETSTLKNIQILSDCNRQIASEYAGDDLMQTWKQYGTIHNTLAKRRTGGQRPPAPAAASAVPTATVKPIAKVPAKAPTPEAVAKPALSRTASTKSDTKQAEPAKKGGKPPALKKESSSIFKAFAAKPKAAPKKEDSKPGASAAASPAPDAEMKDASEDEQEEDFTGNALDADDAKTKADASRRAKEEREETLRKMMEDDEDETMADAPEAGTTTKSLPLEPTADGQSLAPQKPASAEPEEQPTSIVSNGRRRGRRRVMKKKTTKDAEGYLVTKEEMAWESFSESDKETNVKKAKVAAPPAKPAMEKGGKKAPAKKGQGNIMSFFGKK